MLASRKRGVFDILIAIKRGVSVLHIPNQPYSERAPPPRGHRLSYCYDWLNQDSDSGVSLVISLSYMLNFLACY